MGFLGMTKVCHTHGVLIELCDSSCVFSLRTPDNPRFNLERCKVPKLIAQAYRVPHRGELYLGKDNKLHRCNEFRQFSKRSKPKLILLETFDD